MYTVYRYVYTANLSLPSRPPTWSLYIFRIVYRLVFGFKPDRRVLSVSTCVECAKVKKERRAEMGRGVNETKVGSEEYITGGFSRY